MNSMTCLGGGHGLYQTLLAARLCHPESLSAIVTVADDGGSSGRLRKEMGMIPPGDLRMALAALAADDADGKLWSATLQHRFAGTGALAGHAVGNLLIAGLADILGDFQVALDRVAELTHSSGRVFPMVNSPLDIEADVAGLDDDPRIIMPVRGQVAVATTPGTVRRVRLIPEKPEANPLAVEALSGADLITIGPGSWFSSVIPHLLVPDLIDAVSAADSALRVVIVNLTPEAGETQGFTTERHIHMLRQHCPSLKVDVLLLDEHLSRFHSQREHIARAASSIGAEVAYADLRDPHAHGLHQPEKLSEALQTLYRNR